MGLTQLLLNLGISRDSLMWFWGRLSAGALLIVSGMVPLDNYVGPNWHKVITVGATLVLWLSGKYDSSPLPSAQTVAVQQTKKND